MGSKSRIAKYIVPILQKYIDENGIGMYIDCFCGGSNVVDKIKCEHKIASDKNKYLIALLQRVQEGLPLYESVSKELYDAARKAFYASDNTLFKDWEIGNIGFLASYNGRWFDGGYAKSGYEKTKSGQRFRNYYEESKNNLLQQAEQSLFKDIEFKTCDYKEYFPVNCLVYVDPPYENVKQYANALSFDYEEFWNTIREWSKRNIVLVSEQNAPEDFECIWKQEVSRSIKANDKSKAMEKLFILRGSGSL